MKADPTFATEAEMCTKFLTLIGPDWTAYAETAGWDILLVRKADGYQIGVQAKLRLNADVLAQAVEGPWDRDRPGPDFRAALVPYGGAGKLTELAAYCGITVITIRSGLHRIAPYFRPELPTRNSSWSQDWFEQCPATRHPLPEYIPDVAAGASAPVQLTDWKIKALKVAALLTLTGLVRRADFKALNLDIRRWLAGGFWLQSKPGTDLDAAGLPAFVAGPSLPDFAGQHPVVYAQILADAPKWLPVVRPNWTADAVQQAVSALTNPAPISVSKFMSVQSRLIAADPRHGGALVTLERGGEAGQVLVPLGVLEQRVTALARETGNRETTVRYFLAAAVAAGLLPVAAGAQPSHPNEVAA